MSRRNSQAAAPDLRPVAVVVDGTSGGNEYASGLRDRGFRVVHVEAGLWDLSKDSGFRSNDYDELIFNNDQEETLRRVRALNPSLIVGGSEGGVSLAHFFAQELGLPFRNADEFSAAWRDKAEALEVLRRAGVPIAKFAKTSSLQEAEAWALSHNTWPVVVKPLNGAGTNGVTIVNNMKQLRAAYTKIHGVENLYGLKNDSVLMMEYLKGPEYSVDIVISNGKAIVSDVWFYKRPRLKDAATRYDYDLLVSYEDAEKQKLIEYALQVAHALGIRNGPAHIEIKLTPEGPRLVELGARPCGGGLQRLTKIATGRNQVPLTLDAAFNPHVFSDEAVAYRLRTNVAVVFISTEGGKKFNSAVMSEINKLPGVESSGFAYKEGDTMARTVDSPTVVGQINLVHKNRRELMRTLQIIRRLRDSGAFEKQE